MNVRQIRAMHMATEIEHNDARARAVLMVAANNIDGLCLLDDEAARDDGVTYADWRRIAEVIETLKGAT